MTQQEKLKPSLDNTTINLFPKPEQLKSVLPKLIDHKIKEHYIELDPVEWEHVTKVYL